MNPSVTTRSLLAAAASLAIATHAAHAAEINAPTEYKTGKLHPYNRVPEQPPKNSPDAAARSAKQAKPLPGFSVDLWAGEPMLANPVAFCFDPSGRMFVAETHRYRSSFLDIRAYMFLLEADLANRNQDDWLRTVKRDFPNDWQNLSKETEIVRLLEDTDGDGKADKSSVYADGFNGTLDGAAAGLLWDNDALYFTCIPSLWKLTGKDKAEKKEELLRGFGLRYSFTGHDFHGVIKGPDGRLYYSVGDRAASVKTKEGTTIDIPDEGGVFRSEEDGSHAELVMRGLRNPQELAFDDHGNLFTGDNDSDQGDRERWVYIAEGADAGWRIGWQYHPLGKDFNPWIAEKMWEPRVPGKNQPAFMLAPIENLPDGPSGLVYYPGTGFPKEYAGAFFLANYKGSTAKSSVTTFKSSESGATMKLENVSVFLDNVQATDVAFSPDSRFFVSLWDEGWDRTEQGRIFVVAADAARKEQAAQIAEVSKLLKEGFKQRKDEELIKLLAHADQRVRLGGQWELADRLAGVKTQAEGAALAGKIMAVLGAGVDGPAKQLSRLHAIWAIGEASRHVSSERIKADPKMLQPMPKFPQVLAAFDDADPEVRGQILKSIADTPAGFVPELIALYVKKLADPSLRVRYFAAMALAKKGDASVAPAVVRMLRENDGKDEYLQHSGIMALTGTKNEAVLEAAAKDESKALRLAALLAYRRLGSDKVAAFLADQEPALAAEAARAINDEPIAAALPALAKLAVKADGSATEIRDLAVAVRILNANFRLGDAESAQRLATFAASTQDDRLRVVALQMLGKWALPPARDYVMGIYRPLPKRDAALAASPLAQAAAKLLGEKSEKVLVATCDALEANGVAAAGPQLLALVQNTQAPIKGRLGALDALSNLGTPELTAALSSAAADSNPALKTEASKLAGKNDPTTAAKQLSDSFAAAGVPQKKQILNALGGNPSPEAGKALAALVADFAKVPPPVQVELLDAAAKRPEARDALAKYEDSLPKSDPLAKFLPTLSGGDVAAGEKLFKEHAVAACLRCHKVGDTGGDAGPILDGIATRKDRRYLLESIIAPNAVIADGFQMVALTLNDGQLVAGFLKKESDAELTIQTPGEPQPRVVKKTDIKQRDTAPSGMLPNLGDLLTKREIRDLVEYCATLK